MKSYKIFIQTPKIKCFILKAFEKKTFDDFQLSFKFIQCDTNIGVMQEFTVIWKISLLIRSL